MDRLVCQDDKSRKESQKSPTDRYNACEHHFTESSEGLGPGGIHTIHVVEVGHF